MEGHTLPPVDAPVESAPAATEQSPAPEPVFRDATQGYARQEFGWGETQETPAPEPKPDASPAPEQQSTPPAQDASQEQPSADELPDDVIDRVLKDERARERIDRLAANRFGNRLQREREQWRREYEREKAAADEQWSKADAAFTYLEAEGDEAFMDRFGVKSVAEVARWRADYLQERENRQQASVQQQAPDQDALVAELSGQFNDMAIKEVQAAVSGLPFYSDLSDEVRTKLSALKYDPEGNWFGDAIQALTEGLAKRDERIAREHKAALDQARKAGANEADAAREEAAPVIVGATGAARTWKEIERAYAFNEIGREEYLAEKKARRIDY